MVSLVSTVSMISLRFPWFPWFPCCPRFLYGFHSLREGRKEGKKEGRKDHVCSQHLSSVICVHFIFIDLHRDLCLCTSFMFFLGTHCRGPPHPLLFFHQLPLLQAIDKVVPFFKKSLDLVASKLSLEVVPFWKTQANSGDHSATMFLCVFLFFLAFSLGLGI